MGYFIMSSSFTVDIKQNQDWYFATCKALPGLFVANIDFETVNTNIPEGIAMLIKHNSGKDVEVTEIQPTESHSIGNKTYLATFKKAC